MILISPFTVQDENDIRQQLPQMELHIGCETIGVFLAPDGSHIEQYKYMIEKVTYWCDKVRYDHLPAREA